MSNTKKEEKVGVIKRTFRKLYPSYVYDKVEHIPYELLKKENIRLLVLDMDNTLIDNKHTYSKELKKWSKNMTNKGIRLYILSNSIYGKVVKKIAEELNMNYIYKAKKPLLKGFIQISQKTNIPKENIMMVGDQLFTDVWGGNRYGIKTILVRPIKKQEIFISRIKRPFEKIILKHYLKKNGGNK